MGDDSLQRAVQRAQSEPRSVRDGLPELVEVLTGNDTTLQAARRRRAAGAIEAIARSWTSTRRSEGRANGATSA